MSAQLDAAVKALVSTYQSLDVVARGLIVDPEEVAEALMDAEPDTAEFIALQLLEKLNPL